MIQISRRTHEKLWPRTAYLAHWRALPTALTVYERLLLVAQIAVVDCCIRTLQASEQKSSGLLLLFKLKSSRKN